MPERHPPHIHSLSSDKPSPILSLYHVQKPVSQISPHHTLTHSFNQWAWCVPQKSIAGAVGLALGNAPYQIGDRTNLFI
jgi:hypothetical protein